MNKVIKAVLYAFLVLLFANVVAYSFEQYHYDILFVQIYPLASFAYYVRLMGITWAFVVFIVTLMKQKQITTKIRGSK